MAITRIVNPRVYTKDSFYYQFVWEWKVIDDQGETIVGANPDIDLNKEYEIMLYNKYNTPYNENKSFIVKYNIPVSFLDIYNLYKEDGLLQRGANVKFKIREKQENDLNDWSDLFPSDSSFLLAPSVINCSTITNNAKNQMSVTVGPEFRNYYNNNIDNYNLTILKQNADKLSVYASDNNEGLIYEPQANHTAHLEWSANDHGDEWIRFDLDQVTNISNFGEINLRNVGVTPISCDAQISKGEVIDDSRSVTVDVIDNPIYTEDLPRYEVDGFTEITLDSISLSPLNCFYVARYHGNYGYDIDLFFIGDTIDMSGYTHFNFGVVTSGPSTSATIGYTVNEEQWTTVATYNGNSTVELFDIECSSIRLRGNYIGEINDDISVITNYIIPNKDSYKKANSLSLAFDFGLNYNSELALETEYNLYVSEEKISSWGRDDKTTIIIPQEEHNISNIDFIKQIEIPTPSYQGGLIYIKQGYGWKINGTNVSPGETVDCLHGSLKKEKIIIDKNAEEGIFSPLNIIIYGTPNEQEIKFNNKISFLTGTKYAQQIESFDDLNTIRPISNISNNEFTYQYDSTNKHTPVFIYQKMIDNTYNLTNNLSNKNTGVLNTDFEDISKNDLIVTTSPVVDSNNNYALKTSNITEEEINEYTEEHKNMLNVNKIFNSLEEEFEWEAFQIIQSKGQPKLDIRANKDNNFSDLYSYKILIKNKITNRAIVNEELDFKYSDTRHCWCIYKNEVSYPGGYILSDLVHNELSSKEKYHIIIKRIYNEDEHIIDERDVVYENNTDFFLAPSNNINYNPGEEIDFYFSTERNNSENAAQGYPWLIYNNEDNVGYFCYSNEAQNDLGSESVQLYDKTFSDNKQLIHINYHDKPNFTPKEVIPMLDFKITELVETISQTNITNEESMIINSNPSNFSATTNGSCGSFEFDISNQNTEGYIRFINLMYTPKNSQPYQIEILDSVTNEILFSANNLGSTDITNAINRKKISKNANLKFNLTNCTLTSSNTSVYTLNQQNNESLLQKRKFYIDNFSTNEIDYSEIENGSVITGQVLELHKPITLHIEDFTTNMSSNNSIYYKIEKINEYNQDVITPIDDDNSITILQKDRNGNEFTKDFYINSHTNQLKVQNTKTKQITFNNAQKDTIINCILEKEEVED